MLPISSAQNPTIKLIRSLEDKKGRREANMFVAEGLAMLERAEALGWQPEFFVATKPAYIFDSVKPLIVTDKLMAELSAQNNPHDVLAVFKQRFQPHASKEGLWLALEEIRDPGNLGTILRTADGAGASGVILVGDCCDPYSPECVRASTSSVFAMPLVKMSVAALGDLARGWQGSVVGTAGHAKADYRVAFANPALIILGNESRGLSEEATRACKTLVRIPMRKGVESLNVATAAALMLYQAAGPGL